MKRVLLIIGIVVMLASALILPVSCAGSSSQPTFYDSGAANAYISGSQFVQYLLYRFDTTATDYTLTLPSAADIISAVPSPMDDIVIVFAVAADGDSTVNVTGGPGVTVKPSAASVPGNKTVLMYCNLDNTSSGNQKVTIY
jgi:hypothetical protein